MISDEFLNASMARLELTPIASQSFLIDRA